jgi:two-component system OmpR family sensor kinase
MARLFWKLFFACWLAVAFAVACTVAVVLWAVQGERESIATGPAASVSANAMEYAAGTLQQGGAMVLRDWMSMMDRRRLGMPLYALDSAGTDLLGRDVSDDLQACVRAFANPAQESNVARVVSAPTGERYLLIIDVLGKKNPPVVLLIFGTLTSLAVSALLARYLARPIRNLRWAFDAAAEGRLEARVLPMMGRRRDAIADLGRDFDRMAQRLQTLVSAQRNLLHDVSHELRSPLARLQAAIGLARQNPEKLEVSLDRIEREATRLDHLLGETLTLARLESGTDNAALETIDLSDLVASIAEDARFEAEAVNRKVSTQVADELIVRGRADLLHRAVENVVRNAIKYTAEGTTVEITLRGAADPPRAVLTVTDCGPGVPQEELAKIFEAFYRAGARARTNGFGLGLAIAHRAVVEHGGSIIATNLDRRGGLRVQIELPLGTSNE